MQSINSTKGTFPVAAADSKKPNILRRRPALHTPNSVEQNVNVSSAQSKEPKPTPVEIPKSSTKTNNRRCKETKSNARTQNSSQKIVLDSYFCDKYRKAQENSNCKIRFSIPLTKTTNDNADENKSKVDEVGNVENVELPVEVVFSGENNTITLNRLDRDRVLAALESDQFGVGQIVVGDGADQIQYWFCPIIDCNKSYIEKSDLHVHILTHFDLKSYKCNIDDCSQEFINEDLLKQHCDNVHVKHDDKSSNISPVASYINYVFSGYDDGEPRCIIDAALASVGITEDQLTSLKHVDGSRHWLCPQNGCDLQFKALHILKNHILMHYDLRPFKCNYEGCGWGFRYLHKLKKHLNVHKSNSKTAFACPHAGCSKAFSTKYNLSTHIKVHDNKQEGLPCPARTCTLTFDSRPDLESHLEEHTLDDAVHCCESCKKRFWWSSALSTHHARVHSNSPNDLVCPWPRCGKKFTQPCKLRYHIRSHTGDKPYRCTYPSCDKAFSASSKLSRHARQHSKAKEGRFICRECCRPFVRLDNLKEHVLRHMAQGSHQCDSPGCDQKFSTERLLLAHKKKEHGTNITNKTEQIKIVDNVSELRNSPTDFISMECCDDVLRYLRSARTHVPWSPDVSCGLQSPLLPQYSGLLQQRSRDEKRGNPLVCGGLSLDSDGSAANAGLILETSESAISSLPELETDLLESTGDHMNSLLLQEELTDGMLYTTEEDAALQVLLLNEDPAP